jgi:hypothetical protein
MKTWKAIDNWTRAYGIAVAICIVIVIITIIRII